LHEVIVLDLLTPEREQLRTLDQGEQKPVAEPIRSFGRIVICPMIDTWASFTSSGCFRVQRAAFAAMHAPDLLYFGA
jgi:hypothetical protein